MSGLTRFAVRAALWSRNSSACSAAATTVTGPAAAAAAAPAAIGVVVDGGCECELCCCCCSGRLEFATEEVAAGSSHFCNTCTARFLGFMLAIPGIPEAILLLLFMVWHASSGMSGEASLRFFGCKLNLKSEN